MKKNILLAMILASCGLFVACNGAGGQGSGETASKPMESTREQTEESVTASGTDGEPTAPATEEESSATETGGEAGPAAETIVYREYDFSAEIQEWTPEKLADNIKSDDPAYVMAFQDPTVTPVKINKTGLQLHLNAPFSALTIGFPAWGVPDTFCTLSIYEWKGTYSATVAEKALLSVEVRDIVDCAFTKIELGRSMPAGNYLILLHDPGSKSNGGGPGIWNFQSNITAGQLYQDGKPIDGEMQLWVQFDKTPIKPFGLPDTTGSVAATRTEKEKAVRQFRTLMKSMSKFPVSFRVGDTAYNGFGRDFTELGRTLENTDTSETTTVRFLYKDSIEIKLICTLYPYHAAYEWTVYFTNIGNENSPAISEINGCNYTLTAANPHLSGILGDGGYDNQANTPYHDGSPCEQVRWRKAALEEVVLEALKGQIEIIRLEASDAKKAAKSKGDSLQRQLALLKAQYDACGREKFTKYEEYREGKLTAEEYLASKDVLTAKQAALKEQLDECEAQYEANHQKSLAATAQQQTVTRMSGLSDDKLREHLYDAVERILVYDAESIEIVWKFNEIKKDTDNNVGVGA